jgi:hypothetical protein
MQRLHTQPSSRTTSLTSSLDSGWFLAMSPLMSDPSTPSATATQLYERTGA